MTNEAQYMLVRFECGGCKSNWHLRVLARALIGSLAIEQEVEHGVDTGCKGAVTCEKVGEYSDDVEMALRRLKTGGEKYKRFCDEERDVIRSQALLLDMSHDMMAAVLFARNETLLEREAWGARPDVLIGLGSTCVAGVSSANINVQSYACLVKPVRLEIPSEVAADFLITDLKVGKNSQFISPGAIPMSTFNNNRFKYLKIDMDVLQLTMFFTVSVTNINASARNFQGVLVCQTIGER